MWKSKEKSEGKKAVYHTRGVLREFDAAFHQLRPEHFEIPAELEESQIGEVSRLQPRVLTYPEVIDKRISIPAQHSLVRLSKNSTSSAAAVAVGRLEEVKAGRLAGIFFVNWENRRSEP